MLQLWLEDKDYTSDMCKKDFKNHFEIQNAKYKERIS